MPNNSPVGLYIFAIVAFACIIALILVLRRVFASNRKQQAPQNGESYEQEQRLFKLYQNLEDMMDSFETYVIEQHEEIQSSVQYIKDVERRLQSVYAHLDNLSDQESRAQEIKASGLTPLAFEPPAPAVARAHVELQTPDDDMLSYMQEGVQEAQQTAFVPQAPPEPTSSRHERVLELYRAGKMPEDIARELSLTLGETSMIIAMSKEKYLW